MVRARIELRARVVIEDVHAIGPGKADLLDLIDRTGSISAAAKAMGMSYSRAWLLVDTMNGAFRAPVIEAAPGGARGGGAALTAHGREVLVLYRRMQTALEKEARTYLSAFQRRLK